MQDVRTVLKNSLLSYPQITRNILLLLLLGIIFCVWLVFFLTQSKDSFDEENLRLYNFRPEEINRIEIVSPNGNTELVMLDSGRWIISGSPEEEKIADKDSVNKLFDTVLGARILSTVSSAGAAVDDSIYGLDAQNAVRLLIWNEQQEKVADFLVGKSAAGKDSFYGKISGDEAVYILLGRREFLVHNHWLFEETRE